MAAVEKGHYAMTCGEIGQELGLSEIAVKEICKSALKKIRHNPQLMASLIAVRPPLPTRLPSLRNRLRQGGIRVEA